MAKALLVNIDLDVGLDVLHALDAADVPVKVALWAYLEEYEDWRLVLASPRFDAVGIPEGFGLIRKATDAAGIGIDRTPNVVILRMHNSFVKELRRLFAKARNVEGMRLGGQTIGGRYLEDAYVYRIC